MPTRYALRRAFEGSTPIDDKNCQNKIIAQYYTDVYQVVYLFAVTFFSVNKQRRKTYVGSGQISDVYAPQTKLNKEKQNKFN